MRSDKKKKINLRLLGSRLLALTLACLLAVSGSNPASAAYAGEKSNSAAAAYAGENSNSVLTYTAEDSGEYGSESEIMLISEAETGENTSAGSGTESAAAADTAKGTDTATASASSALSAEEVYAQCSKAGVEIRCKDANGTAYVGSGFFIGTHLIMTNYHVISAAQEMTILDYDGKSYDFRWVYGIDEANDLAIISVSQTNSNYLRFAKDVTVGETCYCIGSPLGLTGSFINGMVSRRSKVIDDTDYIQLCMPVGTGLGGGAVVNKYGKVIGVLTLSVPSAQCVAYAVNYDICRTFRSKAKSMKNIKPADFYKANTERSYTSNVYEISDSYSDLSVKTESSLTTPEKDAETIYADSRDAMVDIETVALDENGNVAEMGSGSGFFIGENTILTNRHVVIGATQITVTDYNGNTYTVTDKKINSYDEADMALLTVTADSKTAEHGILAVDSSYIPAVGETVYVLGSPAGLSDTFSYGIVSMSTRTLEGFDYITMTAPITSGSSGGPVFNRYGYVIGMTTLTVTVGQNTNMALQMKYLKF